MWLNVNIRLFHFDACRITVVHHKIKWIDNILGDWRSECDSEPNLIFVTHSIGAHFAQSLLLRRPDILAKTKHIIHLMPFIRFDPPPMKKCLLSSTAHAYEYTTPMMTILSRVMLLALPRKWIDSYLKQAGMDCTRDREIAMDIFLNPKMVKNHLELGLQEIRGEFLFTIAFAGNHISSRLYSLR